MARATVQLNLPPVPVQRLENGDEARVQKVDPIDIPLHMAKAQIGSALKDAMKRSDLALKDLGDPSHVRRVCEGDIPNVIARAWSKPETRREFVIALAEASGLAEVETTVRVKRTA